MMNPNSLLSPSAPSRSQLSEFGGLIALLVALLICCFAVSSQSFWIDESAAVTKAIQPSIGGWWSEMQSEAGSDKQMPLYMLFLWLWEKPFGNGEWTLRAAGVPWLIAGLYLFAGKNLERWIVATFSAFTWYTLDEARPYAMQLGASMAAFGCIERLSVSSRLSPGQTNALLFGLAASLVVLSGSSLLGMIWAVGAFAAFGCVQGPTGISTLARSHYALILITGAVLTSIAAYYFWTLHTGAGASPLATTDWQSLLFTGYELTGFSGLGPGRGELREHSADALKSYLVPLTVMASLSGTVALAGLWHVRKRLATPRLAFAAAAVLATAGLLVTAGFLKHFRVLGRHAAPMAPIVFWILAEGITGLWRTRHLLARGVVMAFVVVTCASSLSLRLSPRHAKDDYRAAANLAKQALHRNEIVWWCAEPRGGSVYGLPVKFNIAAVEPGKPIFIWKSSEETILKLPEPGTAFISRADVFDPYGTLEKFLMQHGYVQVHPVTGFTIWQLPKHSP